MNILTPDVAVDVATLLDRAENLGFSSIAAMELHDEWLHSALMCLGAADKITSRLGLGQECFVDMLQFDSTGGRLEICLARQGDKP